MIIALQENKAPLFSHFPSPAAEYYISLTLRCIIENILIGIENISESSAACDTLE